TAHRALVFGSSKLALLCDPPTRYIDLGHISTGAGHVLVQYLYTNKYQALEWDQSWDSPVVRISQYKTAFEVYNAAHEYELVGLEGLAKERIDLLGAGLDLFTIIDVVKEMYPTPVADGSWLPGYVKSCIKAAFQNPRALLASKFPVDFGDSTSVAKLLL
ncbi:hypothetical protein B0T26DRAFT_773555, partial [Lasiosphaeria miniovina]